MNEKTYKTILFVSFKIQVSNSSMVADSMVFAVESDRILFTVPEKLQEDFRTLKIMVADLYKSQLLNPVVHIDSMNFLGVA